jgi:uncharacterized OB-fold protein
MTPLQFVTAECANHQLDGSCAGVMINPDLSMPRATPRPRCLLAEGKRCQYFEQCVAPMVGWTSDPRRKAGFLAAIAEYRRVTKQGEDLTRQCPDCGAAMRKGNRYCPKCADARRKATLRASQARCRGGAVVMSTVVRGNGPKTPTNAGCILAVIHNPMGDSHHPRNGATTVDIEARRAS